MNTELATQEFNANKARVSELLNKVDLPALEIQVFGAIRLNIHITVESYKTAEKWNSVLHKFCREVKVVKTMIYNKENKGTCLLPTRREGYLIGATI